MESGLFAVSSIDGRYRSKVSDLSPIASEAGLIGYRIRVECAWLLHLASDSVIAAQLKFTKEQLRLLNDLSQSVPTEACQRVKEIERSTNHDVKAVEYYLREVLDASGADSRQLAFIHFACTSEDINNLAYALMLHDARQNVLLVKMHEIIDSLRSLALEHAELPMLSRTHGQTASPSTLGKEIGVFCHRLQKQAKLFAETSLEGKMNGAVGNYNAHYSAYPDVDWPKLSKSFIEERLSLKQNPLTTQIENHDSLIEYHDHLKRFNTILIGLCRDLWSYISIAYFKQKSIAGEVGSSTMPHKVNPIDFENAEGNLGLANGLASHIADKLLISRFQRDLSDSTVLRSLGTIWGHSVIAYSSVLKGLSKLEVNQAKLEEDLDLSWEVLAEPIQTVMRKYGIHDAYERLKSATRGQAVTRESLWSLVDSCEELPDSIKENLKTMSPAKYVGAASHLVKSCLES